MRRAAVITVTGLIAALVLSPTSAVADLGTFPDAPDDVSAVPYVDFSSMDVSNTRQRVRVKYRSRSADNQSATEILWLDTNPGRPGPELQIGFARHSEWWAIPMRNWKRDRSPGARRKWATSPTRRGRCDSTVRVKSNYQRGFTPVSITVKKKRGCLVGKRVRAHLRSNTQTYVHDYSYVDQWPDPVLDRFPNEARTFTPWVRQHKSGRGMRFFDDVDPVRWWTDILSTEVQLTSGSLRVRVEHRPRPEERAATVQVFVDNNDDGIPDWAVELVDSSGPSRFLAVMSDWTTGPGPSTCVVDGELAEVNETLSSFTIPADCVNNPTQVRVAVRTADTAPIGAEPVDWLGGERLWSPAVRAGGVLTAR